MPDVARVKVWIVGEQLSAADLNAEFNNLVNFINTELVDTSTGHEHDGVDSKAVSYTDLTDKPSDRNAFVFPVTGSLTEGADKAPLWHEAFENMTLTEVRAVCKTAPTGQAIIIDINDDGTSIWNSGAERLQIAAGTTSGSTTTITNTSVGKGSIITLDIDQIGSGTAGANLTVYLIYTIQL